MEFKNKLLLSATRLSWKMDPNHGTKSDKRYKLPKVYSEWKAAWTRDNYKCYYCNTDIKAYPEIHHLNGNHADNKKDNLTSICTLCHQSHHLDIVSTSNGGRIIWLPEFSQQELNYLCKALFIAQEAYEQSEMNNQKVPEFARVAKTLLTSLEERVLALEQYFKGGNCSDPGIFANVLLNLPEEAYENRGQTIYPFKLLHSKSRFNRHVKIWMKENEDVPLETWGNLILKGK